ncbi:uncharacterized protein [Dermacentor albipictus]|uniref:uncharacterized protein isoform X3 n=1 Tax=Dermacentor albipictus TaxID=60249 RepID=UPI0038FC1FD6
MAEERNNENTPPAFTFGDEATPRTSQEFFEGPSCTSDCCTTTSDDFFEDLWNAFKSLSYSEDVTGHTHVTESGISNSPPMASSSSSSHPQPSTSHAGTEEISAIPENIASIADEAWKYQWNTQPTPITGGTCNIDGVTDNGSTSYQHLGSTSSIDNARPSTSLAGMEEASASFEDYATRQCSRGAETAMAEESNNGNTPPAFTFGEEATPSTSQEFFEGTLCTPDYCATICDDSFEDQWILFDSLNDSKDGTGHAHVTESGNTSSPPMASSSSINHAQPSTSRAGMEEASAIPENIARNATGTGEREPRVSSGVSGKVSSRRGTSHGNPLKHTGDRTPTLRARDRSSVKMSGHKCEKCGKLLSRADSLPAHYRTHTSERPYKCEICKKSFAHRGSFHKHQQIHTGVKPHICQICTKPFKNKVDLNSHLKSHSSDRPFVCDICNRSYKWKRDLQRHRKRTH